MVLITEGIWKIILPYIPNIIFIAFLLVLLFFLNLLINKVFKRIVRRLGHRYGLLLSEMGLKVILYGTIILLILISIPGVNESMLQLLGVVGAGIVAFSSSSIIANAMSGVLIKIIRPYHLGDMVRIGEFFGKVADIKILHTELETQTKKILSVPNALVMKGAVKNFSRAPPMIHIEVKLGYDLDRLVVERLLLNAARKAGLTHPYVAVLELGDYFITYQLNGEVVQRPEQFMFLQSNLRKLVMDKFVLAGKEIMTPKITGYRSVKDYIAPKRTVQLEKALRKKQVKEQLWARVMGAEVFEEAAMKARRERRKLARKFKSLKAKKEEKKAGVKKKVVKPTVKQKILKPLHKVTKKVGDNVPTFRRVKKSVKFKPKRFVSRKTFLRKPSRWTVVGDKFKFWGVKKKKVRKRKR